MSEQHINSMRVLIQALIKVGYEQDKEVARLTAEVERLKTEPWSFDEYVENRRRFEPELNQWAEKVETLKSEVDGLRSKNCSVCPDIDQIKEKLHLAKQESRIRGECLSAERNENARLTAELERLKEDKSVLIDHMRYLIKDQDVKHAKLSRYENAVEVEGIYSGFNRTIQLIDFKPIKDGQRVKVLIMKGES